MKSLVIFNAAVVVMVGLVAIFVGVWCADGAACMAGMATVLIGGALGIAADTLSST